MILFGLLIYNKKEKIKSTFSEFLINKPSSEITGIDLNDKNFATKPTVFLLLHSMQISLRE